MQVAFWELAPYLVDGDLSDAAASAYVRDNAGKAFEFMVERADEERAAAGLQPIEEVRAAAAEPAERLATVDERRAAFGLPPLAETRASGKDILTLQKDETVEALATLARPCPGVPAALDALSAAGVPFRIATTSGKPRVPVSVDAAELRGHFPPDAIHSGESDFDPPRFKPDPAVYLLAAERAGAMIEDCVAVEDSASGVGSASNAGIGLLVGYVGASHIAEELKESHARMLMAGERADNGRGADIVVREFGDLVPLVDFFRAERAAGKARPFDFSAPNPGVLDKLNGDYWLPEA